MSISGYKCDLSVHIHFSNIYPLLASQERESFGLFCAAQTLKRKNKKKKHEYLDQNEVVARGIISSPWAEEALVSCSPGVPSSLLSPTISNLGLVSVRMGILEQIPLEEQ